MIQLLNLGGFSFVAYSVVTHQGSFGVSQIIPMAIAFLGLVSVQWYVRIFSYYNREKSEAIVKGKKLPEMQFKRLDETGVSSSSFDGDKTLLVFFRANWCPFCMNQLKEVKKHADKLLNDGVKVKFISNQGFKNSKDLAKKLDLPAHFEILQDEDLKGAKVLGIEDIDGSPVGMPGFPKDTVMATVVALDKEGKVLFGDETDNYRRRPNPSTFLHVFEDSKDNNSTKTRPTLTAVKQGA